MAKQDVIEMRAAADSDSSTEVNQDAVDMQRLGKKQELNVGIPHLEAPNRSYPLTTDSGISTPSPSWA